MPLWARRFVERWNSPRSRRVSKASLALIFLLVIALLSGNQFFFLLANQLRTGFGLFQQAHPLQSSPALLNLASPQARVRGQDGIACLLDAQWSPRGDAIAVLGVDDELYESGFEDNPFRLVGAVQVQRLDHAPEEAAARVLQVTGEGVKDVTGRTR